MTATAADPAAGSRATGPVRAAVLRAAGTPLRIEPVTLPAPGPGQVLVRMAAAGVCRSDLSLADATLPQPVPAVLGHEGAGTVLATGPGVRRVAAGEPVLLDWWPACGGCPACRDGRPFHCPAAARAGGEPYAALADGTPVHAALGTAAFAERTLVAERAVIPLPPGLAPVDAAVLGCAAITGFGAVTNSARVRPGESVAVWGAGGIGLCAIQAARIAGASPVVAVDAAAGKEPLARAAGADEFVVAGGGAAAAVRALTGGGADHVLECVGRGATIRQSWEATRAGGRTTVVGVGGRDDRVSFSALELFRTARTIAVCVHGDSDPARDVPVLAEHVRAGRLRLDALVTHRIGLDELPAALARTGQGDGGRALVVL